MANAKLTINDLPNELTSLADDDLLAVWDTSGISTAKITSANVTASLVAPAVTVEATNRINADANLQAQVDLKAPLADPEFTGVPTAPTAAPGTNDGTIANTAFVKAAVDSAAGAVSSVNTKTGAVVLTPTDIGLGGFTGYTPDTLPLSTATTDGLAAKEPSITPGSVAQYLRGDKTFQPVIDLPVSTAQNTAITNRLSALNVLNYGADPTGVADSYAAFVSAIAAAAIGADIKVPSGTYELSANPWPGGASGLSTKSLTWHFEAGTVWTGAGAASNVSPNGFPSNIGNGWQLPIGTYLRAVPTDIAPTSGGTSLFSVETIQSPSRAGADVAMFISATAQSTVGGNVWGINGTAYAAPGANGTIQFAEIDCQNSSASANLIGIALTVNGGAGTYNGNVAYSFAGNGGGKWNSAIQGGDCVTFATLYPQNMTNGIYDVLSGAASGSWMQVKQLAAGTSMLKLSRSTDTSPTGNFFELLKADTSTDLFRIGIDGNIVATPDNFSFTSQTNGQSNFTNERYIASAGAHSTIVRKARGTVSSPAIVQANDLIGRTQAAAYNGSGFTTVMQLDIFISDPNTVTSANMGATWRLQLVPNGSNALQATFDVSYDAGLVFRQKTVVCAAALPVRGVYTVAQVTAISSTLLVNGASAIVTDATAPTSGAVVAGGGSVRVGVNWDGANWRVD